eukprot:TRINITY_DN3458_c0_g1_i2.p2 TRINITY_DN3458_c0_g1~~TRINITY_DN3458_c0_g1_i2.p2  ORF type:complete len:175 (+),score=59.84 TRINITY_DN3458_c0_g1_i2:385-909(+)
MSMVSASSFEYLLLELSTHTIQKDDPPVALFRLDAMGYRAGLRLADKYALKHEPRLVGDLQVVKWLCKDFWQRSFGKDIDALKTDYQGTFLLCDNSFSALQPFLAGAYTKEQLLPYLAYPCGLVRGALSSLGVEANVAPELETLEDRTVRLPKCSFRISVKRATEDTTATAAQP